MFNRLLCRIRLRSALIWAEEGDERIYLNAEHVGTRNKATWRELLLRELDGQRAADLDMFVYLTFPVKTAKDVEPDGNATVGKLFARERFDLRDVLVREVAAGGRGEDQGNVIKGEDVRKGPAGADKTPDKGGGDVSQVVKKGDLADEIGKAAGSLADALKKGRSGRIK